MIGRSPDHDYYIGRYIDCADRWTIHRPARHKITRCLIDQVRQMSGVQSLRLLDVGCGRLTLSLALRRSVAQLEITAIDFAYSGLVSIYPGLTQRAHISNITFLEANAMTFATSHPFDVVVDFGVLHHLIPSDWSRYAEAIDRLAATSASMFVCCFHPLDREWNHPTSGGFYRKGGSRRDNQCYCHYHSTESLQHVFRGVFTSSNELTRSRRMGHVVALHVPRR